MPNKHIKSYMKQQPGITTGASFVRLPYATNSLYMADISA